MGKDKRKPLIELDGPDGNIIQFWESGRDAANFYGFSPVYISQQLKNRIRAAKKHYFRYATEGEIEAYRTVKQRVDEKKEESPEPVAPIEETLPAPAEFIPEAIDKPHAHTEGLTPFDRLVKKGKENLK